MSVKWKINGVLAGSQGLHNLVLRTINQQAETLSFDDPTAAFDAALAYNIGDLHQAQRCPR